MKKNNGKGWERIECNLCGNKSYDVVWNNATSWLSKGVFRIVKCRECKLVYLSPRPSQKIISKYYEPDSYWGFNIYDFETKADYLERDKVYGFLYKDTIARKQFGTILDIGAGTGLFLTKYKEKGWETIGVELSKEACEYAKRVYGMTLINGDFLKHSFPKNKFDLVTLNNSLEHIHSPKETLKKISSLLKDGGLLLITVPNFNSIGSKIFGKEWYALQPPTHLYHFTPESLTSLLNKTDFRVEMIKHSNWRQNYYILFESIRILFSQKFRKRSKGNLINKEKIKKKSTQTLSLISGKIAAKAVTFLLTFIEQIVKRGEVIIVYAEKA